MLHRITAILAMTAFATRLFSATVTLPSFEWLTVSADRIVRGFITDFTPAKDADGREMAFCSFQFHEMMKGPQERNFTFACYDMPADSLEKYRDRRIEVLIMFGNLEKPLMHNGKEVTVRTLTAGSAPAVLNLATPQELFFSAFDFSILRQKTGLLDLCRIIIAQTALHADVNNALKKLYLAVPPETEVYRKAGDGKKLFLEVPAFLFPDAVKKPK